MIGLRWQSNTAQNEPQIESAAETTDDKKLESRLPHTKPSVVAAHKAAYSWRLEETPGVVNGQIGKEYVGLHCKLSSSFSPLVNVFGFLIKRQQDKGYCHMLYQLQSDPSRQDWSTKSLI